MNESYLLLLYKKLINVRAIKQLSTFYEGGKRFSLNQTAMMAPGADEVQIAVAYTGICGTDIHIYHGHMDSRVNPPMTLGHEMSGTVHAIGKDVTQFKVGDKIAVRPLDTRGEKPSDKGFSHVSANLKILGVDSPGAMQQFWNVPEFTIHKLSDDIDLRLASLAEPLAVACHDVRLANLKAGELAVVLGGGPIGLLIALAARNMGSEVVLFEINTSRIDLAQSLGLTVFNPTQIDPVELIAKRSGDRMADVVFEVAGVQSTVKLMTELAGIRSRIVQVAIHAQPMEVNLFQVFWKELQLFGARVYEKEDFDEAIRLITDGLLPLNELITDVRPLADIQQVFDEIDASPGGMKYLLDCQKV